VITDINTIFRPFVTGSDESRWANTAAGSVSPTLLLCRWTSARSSCLSFSLFRCSVLRLFNYFIYYMQHIITFCNIIKADFYDWDDFIFLILLLCKWVLVGKPEGKRPLERPRRRWEDNIKNGLQEVRWSGMDWIDMYIGTGSGHL
jgi:hypothetical protein